MSKTLTDYLTEWQPQPLTSATTLPAELYCSPEVYRLEQQQVFGKAWYYVGHLSQLDEPGSFFTVEIAEQPIVVLRTKAGLRGFFNVCPHRAGPIAQGSGKCNRFICQYHAWNFDLEGNLRQAPEMAEAIGFDPVSHALTAVRVETWGPFIFANADDSAVSLASTLGDVPALFDRYQFSQLARVHSVDYWTAVNWKTFNEITVESYHESVLHPTTLAQYYHCAQTIGTVQHGCYLQYAPLILNERLEAELQPEFCIETLSQAEQKSFNMVCLFPNFTLVMCPNCCFTFLVDPQGVDRTRIRIDWLVPDRKEAKSPANLAPLIQFFDELMQEDLKLLPSIQLRIGSIGYHRGQLSPKREMGVHLFQQLLMQYLTQQN